MATTSLYGYTEIHRLQLWQWHRAGVAYRAIALRFGKEPGSVHEVIREAGGVPPRLRMRSARVLSTAERELIARFVSAGRGVREIARLLGRAPSTISRELAAHTGPGGVRCRCRRSRGLGGGTAPEALSAGVLSGARDLCELGARTALVPGAD